MIAYFLLSHHDLILVKIYFVFLVLYYSISSEIFDDITLNTAIKSRVNKSPTSVKTMYCCNLLEHMCSTFLAHLDSPYLLILTTNI